MAAKQSRTTFAKLDRERKRREKRADKQARKEARKDGTLVAERELAHEARSDAEPGAEAPDA